MDREHRLAVLVALLGLLVCAPVDERSAQAAPAPPEASGRPHDDGRERAQALLDEGIRLTDRGEFAPALARFEAAYDAYPSVKLLLNSGTCLRHLGRHAEAARSYERYMAAPDADPQRVAELRHILDAIDLLVGTLVIEVDSPGARVRVDGEPLDGFSGKATRRLDPGEHTVLVLRPGQPAHVQVVAIDARARASIQLTVDRDESDTGSQQRIAAYSLGALGIIGVAVGGTFGVLALISDAELDETPTPELETAARRDATVAIVGLAAGGAALAAGVILYVTAPDDAAEASIATAVLPGGGAGVRVRAQW